MQRPYLSLIMSIRWRGHPRASFIQQKKLSMLSVFTPQSLMLRVNDRLMDRRKMYRVQLAAAGDFRHAAIAGTHTHTNIDDDTPLAGIDWVQLIIPEEEGDVPPSPPSPLKPLAFAPFFGPTDFASSYRFSLSLSLSCCCLVWFVI